MLKYTLILSLIFSFSAAKVSSSWFQGPLRLNDPDSTICIDEFPNDGEYMLLNQDTQHSMSYCGDRCLLRKSRPFSNIDQTVVCQDNKGVRSWGNVWTVKRLPTPGTIQIFMPKVGGLKIRPKADEVETALVFDDLEPTVWTYERVPNPFGLCITVLKSVEGGYYIRRTGLYDTPDWLVIERKSHNAEIATKVEPDEKSISNYKFLVHRL